MAITVTVVETIDFGSISGVVGTLAFDSSYPTGGESLTAANLGLGALVFLIVNGEDGYMYDWDKTNNKIIVRYADYDASSDGALIQVPDTTNLSGITAVHFFALGY